VDGCIVGNTASFPMIAAFQKHLAAPLHQTPSLKVKWCLLDMTSSSHVERKNVERICLWPHAFCHSTSCVAMRFGRILPLLQQCGWAWDSCCYSNQCGNCAGRLLRQHMKYQVISAWDIAFGDFVCFLHPSLFPTYFHERWSGKIRSP